MIYGNDTLYGLDTKVRLIQRVLDKKLPLRWYGDISIYGVIQETTKDGNRIPEVYTGNNEYKELYIDDSKAALICFKIEQRKVEGHTHSASVDIIFNTVLQRIIGTNTRDAEKVLMEAYNILKKCGYVNNITAIKQGIDQVYAGFYTANILNKDMEPYFIFSITCEVTYHSNI